MWPLETMYSNWVFLEQVGTALDSLTREYGVRAGRNQKDGQLGAILERMAEEPNPPALPEVWLELLDRLEADAALAAEIRSVGRGYARWYFVPGGGKTYDPGLEDIVPVVIESLWWVVVNNAAAWAARPDRRDSWRGLLFSHIDKVTRRNVNEMLGKPRTAGEKPAHVRPQAIQPRAIDSELAARAVAGPVPLEQLELADEIDRLRRAVQRLPERERAVIVGRVFREMPWKDIAAEFGLAESQIRKVYGAAMELLHRMLE